MHQNLVATNILVVFHMGVYIRSKYHSWHTVRENVNISERVVKPPIEIIYKYTIEIFFSLSLFRLRNVCLISRYIYK